MSAQNAKRVPLGANPGGAVLLTRLRIRFGGAPNRENGAKRLSALTRRGADPHYGIVNCWPARRCVWPVIAPAQALVRAGAGLRGDARSVGVVCVRCASVIAVLSGRFALGSRLPWVLLGRFAFGVRLSLRLCRGALRLVHACREVLLRRLRSVCVCHCGSVGAVCLGSRLLFVFRQTGRLAVPCVPVPPGRDRHSCVLAVLARLSASVGSLRVWPFICGDLDGVTGDAGRTGDGGYEGTGLAARPLFIFTLPHWPCNAFRGENAGAARPRLRQRVFDSLDSLHAAAGLCWCVFAPPSPGYTERPARL